MLTVFLVPALPAAVTKETITYGGWPHCVRLSNGKVELVATTDVGPRVIRLAIVGGRNLFKELPGQIGQTGGNEWRAYGGHRLWHAPEAMPRSYAPDNERVAVVWDGTTLKLTAPVEPLTGLQKEMGITLRESGEILVNHRLINHGQWEVETAPWGLSVCDGPGRAIIPQEPYVAHAKKLLPARTMTLWGYTDMQDSRFSFGTKFVQVRIDPERKFSQKIGFMDTPGWAAFCGPEAVFLKRFAWQPQATYADFGCNLEVFTSGGMLELESLGPLTKLAPGAAVDHLEKWYVFPEKLGEDESALDTQFKSLLSRTTPVEVP